MAINRELSQFGRLLQIVDNVSIGIGTTSNVNIGFGTITVTSLTATNISGSAANLTGITGASANTYGNATTVPQIIVDTNGRITSVSNVTISFPTPSQWQTTAAGINTSSKVGIATTNPTSTLTVGGAVEIQQDAGSNNRLIFRGTTGSSYRWNIDNYQSSNTLRIFREDDATAANGSVAVSISTTGTLTATKFSGDGSLLTNLPSGGGGGGGTSSQWTSGATGITTTSSVGIKSTTPTSALDVTGDVKVTGIVTANTFRARGGAPGALGANNNGYGFFGSGDNDSGMYSSADGQIEFYSNSTEVARIASGGNFGVNNTNPTSKLDVTGDVKVSGIITATDFNSSSDINLKTNIQIIENPIDKLFEINGVTFNWIENEKASVGVIAQDVERALPQLVNNMGSHKVVNYSGLIGLLVECIKHQQKQIDELKEHMIGS